MASAIIYYGYTNMSGCYKGGSINDKGGSIFFFDIFSSALRYCRAVAQSRAKNAKNTPPYWGLY